MFARLGSSLAKKSTIQAVATRAFHASGIQRAYKFDASLGLTEDQKMFQVCLHNFFDRQLRAMIFSSSD